MGICTGVFDSLVVAVLSRVRFLVGNSAIDLTSPFSLEEMGFWRGIAHVGTMNHQHPDGSHYYNK